MNATHDLQVALEFVIRRIQNEGVQSGEPLTEEEALLLRQLPRRPLFPQGRSLPAKIPRDFPYERLCALAKAAYQSDRQKSDLRPWHFAFAVTRLHQHPMEWLLKWGGLKDQKPWWDGWLLLAAALAAIAGMMSLIFFNTGTNPPIRWLVTNAGCVALFGLAYLGTRKLEHFELKRAIEKNRPPHSSE
jgi:hypothetical protein